MAAVFRLRIDNMNGVFPNLNADARHVIPGIRAAECQHGAMSPASRAPFVVAACVALTACGSATHRAVGPSSTTTTASTATTGSTSSSTPTSTSSSVSSAPPAPSATPSSDKRLRLIRTVTGNIAPKSVSASGTGLVFAQNMMYRHTITVYDRDGNLVHTIPDAVNLAAEGHPELNGAVKGAPVEAAFTPDHKDAFVSNYSMFGPGFPHPGDDTCSPSSGIDHSYVYRIDLATFVIDAAIPVGAVPKFVAVSPDGKHAFASNWCSYDFSVIDTSTNTETARLKLGAYPRGIAIDPSSTNAYVAVMGSYDIAKIALADNSITWIKGVGNAPRHLVMDPKGAFLYATLNGEGTVAKIDLSTGKVDAKVHTGSAPRSMAIAPDGQSLYVVNYDSSTITKLATSDLHMLQTITTPTHPIGIAYEPTANRVWVACYSGAILLFDDA